jgi:hypothetical protein
LAEDSSDSSDDDDEEATGLLSDDVIGDLCALPATSMKLRVGVDSCVSATVLPEKLFPEYPSQVDALVGRKFRSANAAIIVDKGSKTLRGRVNGSGPVRSAKFRVAAVSRALMCVADMVDRGQRIVFEARNGTDESYIEDVETGVRTPLTRINRIYEFVIDVEPVPASGFTRRR